MTNAQKLAIRLSELRQKLERIIRQRTELTETASKTKCGPHGGRIP